MTAPLAAPPYALPTFEHPCPDLAALAARADAGGPREVAMACCVLARLAAAIASPVELSGDLRRERADGARAWLSTLPLRQEQRVPLVRALKSTATGTPAEVAAELDVVTEALSDTLDTAASANLTSIAQRLRGKPVADSRR